MGDGGCWYVGMALSHSPESTTTFAFAFFLLKPHAHPRIGNACFHDTVTYATPAREYDKKKKRRTKKMKKPREQKSKRNWG